MLSCSFAVLFSPLFCQQPTLRLPHRSNSKQKFALLQTKLLIESGAATLARRAVTENSVPLRQMTY
jgi:hypothetical protein